MVVDGTRKEIVMVIIANLRETKGHFVNCALGFVGLRKEKCQMAYKCIRPCQLWEPFDEPKALPLPKFAWFAGSGNSWSRQKLFKERIAECHDRCMSWFFENNNYDLSMINDDEVTLIDTWKIVLHTVCISTRKSDSKLEGSLILNEII